MEMEQLNDKVLVKVHALREGYKAQLQEYAEQLTNHLAGIDSENTKALESLFQLLHTITGSSGTFELPGVEDASRAACNYVRYIREDLNLGAERINLIGHYVHYLLKKIKELKDEEFEVYRDSSRKLVRRKIVMLSQPNRELHYLSKDIARSGYAVEMVEDLDGLEIHFDKDSGLLVNEDFFNTSDELYEVVAHFNFVVRVDPSGKAKNREGVVTLFPRDSIMLALDLASKRIPSVPESS